MRTETTRRELLEHGALLAGAFTIGSWASPGNAAGSPTTTIALSAERRTTYASLAETVLGGPSFRLPAGAADTALADFERAYVTWPVHDRRRADAILDAVSRDVTGRDRGRREDALRGHGPRGPKLAADALSLVAVALAEVDVEAGAQTVVTL